jgi:hypothetical protein
LEIAATNSKGRGDRSEPCPRFSETQVVMAIVGQV